MNIGFFLPKAIHTHRQLIVDMVNTMDLQSVVAESMYYQISRPPAIISGGPALVENPH